MSSSTVKAIPVIPSQAVFIRALRAKLYIIIIIFKDDNDKDDDIKTVSLIF